MSWLVDEILNHRDPWHLPPAEAAELRYSAIRQSLEHHLESCRPYRRLCDARGFELGALRGREDLLKVPLVSTRAFKEKLSLLSVPAEAIVKTHCSSGTSGSRSLVPRDQVTLDRFVRGLERCILDLQGESGYLAMLGPSPEEMGDLAMANFSAVGCRLASGHDYFLKQRRFDPAEVVAAVNATPLRPVQLGGAPVLVLGLARYLLESKQRLTTLTADTRITTGGGFKTYTGEAIPRADYDRLVIAAFGVSPDNIRDIYGMTELNGFLGECSARFKHVPPWIQLSVRDPAQPEREVAKGDEGLPAFLDPGAHSYPGFIIADDMVRVAVGEGERCACGRVGPCLEPVVRRAEGAEARGCGRHVDELRASAGVVA